MKSKFIDRILCSIEKYNSKTVIVDNRGERNTTYGEMKNLIQKTVSYISSQGISNQQFITLEIPESFEYIAVEIGIWLSRCIPVPVGVAFPVERKAYIRNHCDSVLDIDENVLLEIKKSSSENVTFQIPDEFDNALLLYTSGSTGNPKGVLHDFKSLDNAIEMLKVQAPTETDKYATGVPSYFVAHLFYYMFIFGTEVHIISTEINKDVEALVKYHNDKDITLAFISATVFPLYKNDSKTIRSVSTGSDRIINPIKRTFTPIATYGLSETAGPIISCVIDGITDNSPIGMPIPGVELAILDDNMQEVENGQEGEICLRGHFAKCYFKEEELTKELYRGGWLHTKDLGKILPDGKLQFVNRKDWMVKVNGQRVEPGEIEAAMRRIPEIERAVVKGFDNEQGSKYLCAFYSLKDSNKLDKSSIREYLSNVLPAYMVPSRFVELDFFPLNQNGKIDRLSLIPPTIESDIEKYVSPRNEIEKELCLLMADILGVSRIGIDDNFFSLGGDSIKVMKLQQKFSGMFLPVNVVVSCCTPRKIAERLSSDPDNGLFASNELVSSKKGKLINTKKMFLVNHLFDILPNSGCQKLKTKLLRWAGVKVGKNLEVFQGFKIHGVGDIEIGDNVFLGHESMIMINEGSKVVIEDFSGLGTRSIIITGFHPLTPDGDRIVGEEGTNSVVRLCKGCCVTTSCTVLPGVTIGEKAMVSAGALVSSDVESYTVVAGVPACYVDKLV